jgi:uncharacterized membrane protein (UPF0127 family)
VNRSIKWILPLLLLALITRCGEKDGEKAVEGEKQKAQISQTAEDSLSADGQVIIQVAGKPVRVRISQTPGEMERGLMFTEHLPPDEGMLFVFDREKILHFWMKNTPIPLSVAFIDKRGRILEIQEMRPLDEQVSYTSRQPAIYALEMNAGWFQEQGVEVGDEVKF